MITEHAFASIAELFERSIQNNVASDRNNQCNVARVDESELILPLGSKDSHLVVLNLSTYDFRIVTLFNFVSDQASVDYLAKLSRHPGALSGQALLDAYGELVNMVCGEVNRGLSVVARHIGMSTPFVLSSTCAAYLSILNPSRVQVFEVCVNDDFQLKAAVCVCTAKNAQIDFSIDIPSQQTASVGELEFF